MTNIRRWFSFVAIICISTEALAAVTTAAPNAYFSIMTASAGDTVASSAYQLGFSLAGDIIGPSELGSTAIGAGFWYGDADKSRLAAPTSVYLGETLPPIMTDWNRNRSSSLADTAIVTVVNLATGESESLTLTETAASSGGFGIAGMTISYAPSDSASGSGTLYALPGELLEVRYSDPSNLGDTSVVTGIVARFRPSTATGFMPATVTLGDSIASNVRDSDENRDGSLLETVTATLRNAFTGETEAVILTETAASSGSFAGTLSIRSALSDIASGSGTMYALAGDTILLAYTDRDDAFDSLTAGPALVFPAVSLSAFATATTVRIGETLAPVVADSDRNRNGRLIETIAVTIRNSSTGETELLTLIETDSNSGVFDSASIRISGQPSDSLTESGSIFARGGDSIVVLYTDIGNQADTVSRSVLAFDDSGPGAFSLVSPADGLLTTATAITFTWTASSDSQSPVTYRLQVVNDAFFLSLVLDSSGLTETAATAILQANAWYRWRVIASDGSGNTIGAGPRTLGIDTQAPLPPVAISPKQSTETSAQVLLRWKASSDSALANPTLAPFATGIFYRVQVARDSLFSTLTASDTTSDTSRTILLASSDTGVFYWRIVAVDSAGNISDWSGPDTFLRATPPDTVPPLAPFNLRGRVTDTGAVQLTWEPSPSTDVAGYRVYWDAGADTTPATFLGFVTNNSEPLFSWITAPLLIGNYGFRVEAIDRDGNSELNTNIVRVLVGDTASSCAKTDIITPQTGKRVNRTGGVEVVARILGTDAERAAVTGARFQYRRSGGAWTDMAVTSNKTNPVTWRGSGNINTHWDASALALGLIEIRVVPISGGTTSESCAGAITITLVGNKSEAEISNAVDIAADSSAVEQHVFTGRSDTVVITSPSGSEVTVLLDSGDAPSAPDTDPVKLIIQLLTSPPVETSSLGGRPTVGVTASATFSGGKQPGGFVEFLLPLANRGGNSVTVNGKTVPLSSLEAWSWSADTGRWEKLDSPSIDIVNGYARIRVRHFSFFTLAAPVAGVTSLAAFQVFPVPFVPNDASADNGVEYQAGVANTGITFRNIPASSRLKIFDALGTLVAEVLIDASGGAQWDVRNGRGEKVASGVYVFLVTAPTGERKTGKLVVIR